jgi:hypothetical protein
MPAEIECVRAWLESQARGSSMDAGSGGDASDDAPPEARARIPRIDGSVPSERVRCT